MSRSRKKSPVWTFCKSGTMRAWRRTVNKRLRHNNKLQLEKALKTDDFDTLVLQHWREAGNDWDSPRDGHYRWVILSRVCVIESHICGIEKMWKKIYRK